jgi:hypothetical protein
MIRVDFEIDLNADAEFTYQTQMSAEPTSPLPLKSVIQVSAVDDGSGVPVADCDVYITTSPPAATVLNWVKAGSFSLPVDGQNAGDFVISKPFSWIKIVRTSAAVVGKLVFESANEALV